MKNRGYKLIMLMLVVVMAAMLLSACGLFGSLTEITSVEIAPSSDLVKIASGEYTTYANTSVRVTAAWDNKRILKPSVEWHWRDASDSDDNVDTASGASWSHTFGEESIGKTYELYAVIHEIESNKIKIKINEAELSEPKLTSTTHTIANGIIQQNLNESVTDVTLAVSWNEEQLSAARNESISIEWLVDGVAQLGEQAKAFTYEASIIKKACTREIGVALYEDGVKKTYSSILLSFVNSYEPISSILLGVNEDVDTLCEGVYYVQKPTGASGTLLTLNCEILPIKANQNAPCTLIVTNATGQYETELSEGVALTYGKYEIRARVQNVESRSITVYYLNYAVDSIPQSIKQHMTDRFFYAGDWHDSYISSQADVNAFMGYAISKHQANQPFEAYLADSRYLENGALSEACSNAVDDAADESGAFKYSVRVSGNIGTITFGEDTVFGIPSGKYSPTTEVSQIKGYLRYSEQSTDRSVLPIDEASESMPVANSNDLYRAVSNGFKPIFEDNADGTRLELLYQEARDVLVKYVSDDMSELERVAVIYDWIVNVVDYDYDVAAASEENTSKYNAFYLEGVFLDHRAVCDGKSKAFALLCGMEGIRAVRVCGYAGQNIGKYTLEQLKTSGAGHAWNKVLVDVDGDGIREWYVVDTTWGDVASRKGGAVYEYLTYEYFLKTDDEVEDTHVERTSAPKTTTQTYNVYAATYITIGGKSVDLCIDSKQEAMAIINYSKSAGELAICVLDKGGYLKQVSGYAGIDLGDGQYIVYAIA